MAVVGSHRRVTPDPTATIPPGVAAALRRNSLAMAVANMVTAAGMVFADPGVSASLAFLGFLAPLPLWGCGFAAAAVFQVANRPLVGHSIAAPLWALLAVGAVYGLVAGRSTAPAASIILAGLTLYAAGHHLNAMAFRRREAQVRRDG